MSNSSRRLMNRHGLFLAAGVAFAVAFITWAWVPCPLVSHVAALAAFVGFAVTLLLDQRVKRAARTEN